MAQNNFYVISHRKKAMILIGAVSYMEEEIMR